MGMAREAVDDTAGAAQMVADQQLRGTAAIASSRAAELYGLELLEKGIQDDKENVTRFVVLSRWEGQRGGRGDGASVRGAV